MCQGTGLPRLSTSHPLIWSVFPLLRHPVLLVVIVLLLFVDASILPFVGFHCLSILVHRFLNSVHSLLFAFSWPFVGFALFSNALSSMPLFCSLLVNTCSLSFDGSVLNLALFRFFSSFQLAIGSHLFSCALLFWRGTVTVQIYHVFCKIAFKFMMVLHN